MIMKPMILPTLAFALGLPFATQAANENNAQDAINDLRGSIAEAELTLSLVEADSAIRQVRAQEAINQLAYGIAEAEVSIALADANELIHSVSDQQMLAELNSLLDSNNPASESLLMAVVGERPALGNDVYQMALSAGYNQDQVAAMMLKGMSDMPATAAGK